MNYLLLISLTILFVICFNVGKFIGYKECLEKHRKIIKSVDEINNLLDKVTKNKQ